MALQLAGWAPTASLRLRDAELGAAGACVCDHTSHAPAQPALLGLMEDARQRTADILSDSRSFRDLLLPDDLVKGLHRCRADAVLWK